MSQRFHFFDGPWENSTAPTIVRDDPSGGDPHIVATLARIYRPDEIHELCRLANHSDDALDALIDERDAAEETLSHAYFIVMGRSPEWSNLFGYAEALEEIEDACALLRRAAAQDTTGAQPTQDKSGDGR